ncbi:AVAST type 1 anti-phage system protein Avs1c [Enterovibrio norvegicus]|uniref:AVAST type 1 anti-phage system protein Avs1c n=1 Tax=Enterovibrio norvegicus TaxID=188144 RepID=UPI0024B1A0C7|nr:AVAST type 1 anti-phage system protein Avs1c [Enterovibrio norvegicus]
MEKIDPMDTPRTREEFELRFHSLTHGVKSGKTHLGPTIDSLLNLRKLPNGRLDFLSVDESARLNANSMYHFKKMFERNGSLFENLNDGGDSS